VEIYVYFCPSVRPFEQLDMLFTTNTSLLASFFISFFLLSKPTVLGKEGVLEPSVDSTESEEEEIVRVAFDRPFQDPSDLSERFMVFIDKCSYEYETTKDYYAPYATLIQASGTGKSKLLKNFAENRMTVYCCLRESKSSGYPSRSHIANILLHEFENERDAIVTYLAYVCACCQRLEEFNGSCKEWFDEHTNKKLQVDFGRILNTECLILCVGL